MHRVGIRWRNREVSATMKIMRERLREDQEQQRAEGIMQRTAARWRNREIAATVKEWYRNFQNEITLDLKSDIEELLEKFSANAQVMLIDAHINAAILC